jgi:autotransporter-associated beta strand protein
MSRRSVSRRQFLRRLGGTLAAGVGIALFPTGFASALSKTGPTSTPGTKGGGPAIPRDPGQFTYPGDPGRVATGPGDLAAAKASWETPEYGFYTGHNPSNPGTAVDSPWQLVAVNASTAYALGYCGQGVTLGMMDSGYRTTHEAFQTELIAPVSADVEGVYATSGFSYRTTATPANPFTAGEPFTVAGDQARTSDYSHGTGMLGVISGKRDGKEQHGIAFGSKIFDAKTGGSDTMSHGPFHDYVYFHTGTKALVDAGAQAINESWGSFVQTLDRTRFDGLANDLGVNGNLANAYQLLGKDSASPTAMRTILPNEYLKDLEYQYFFFKKCYSVGGEQYNPNYPGLSFMDAIWDAIKDSGTIDVRSSGNNDWSNPYFRPAYPLFNPRAENQFVAVGGVQPPTEANPEYTKQFGFNEAGLAKWWIVSTPSNSVRTTSSAGDTNYSNSSGTSPATPVATAVIGVLLSRYPNMDAKQVRDLMFTTANNKMSDGVRFLGTGQTSPSGASIAWTAPDGLPDERWGWGIPDLAKGMYGPRQFLSPMTYNMNKAPLDVWSNDISQIAIKEREREDLQWLAGYKQHGIAYAGEFSPNVLNPDGTLNEQAFMLQGILADPYIQAITNGHPELYDKITYEDAVKWRKEWMDARAAYIQNKIDNNLYTASLVKQGSGMLIMTGDDTYEGGTTVEGGKLSITGSHASSIHVKGGTLGGSGFVAASIDVDSGVLQPGLSSEEAASAASVTFADVAPGNVLDVGGDVTVSRAGRLAITISGDHDYTSVRAAGYLVLDGELALDIRAPLTPGTVLTIMSGDSIKGNFHSLPEQRILNAGHHLFRVSYQDGDVTLTVVRTLPGAGSGGV